MMDDRQAQLPAGQEVERDGIEHVPDRWEVFWARVFQAVGEVHEIDEGRHI